MIADSTTLVDLLDSEARFGYIDKGKFYGFKLHEAVSQQGLPLRAAVSSANRHDLIRLIFQGLIWDLKANYVLADAGIDRKENLNSQNHQRQAPIAANPRRKDKTKTKPRQKKLLRAKRYRAKQFNSHIKVNLLKSCYLYPKDIAKEASMVFATLIGIMLRRLGLNF